MNIFVLYFSILINHDFYLQIQPFNYKILTFMQFSFLDAIVSFPSFRGTFKNTVLSAIARIRIVLILPF